MYERFLLFPLSTLSNGVLFFSMSTSKLPSADTTFSLFRQLLMHLNNRRMNIADIFVLVKFATTD